MKKNLLIALAAAVALAAAAIVLASCGGLRPNVTAGYYLDLKPESKGNVTIGSNGTQSNSINASVSPAQVAGEAQKTDGEEGNVRSSGLFVNSGNFQRSSDTDLSAAVEALRNVKASTAAQTSARDSATQNGQASSTASETETRETNLPVSVNGGLASTSGASAGPKEDAQPPAADTGADGKAQ